MKTEEKKVYLEPEDLKKLQMKAQELGIEGRGWLSHFLEKVAKQPLIFLDSNAQKLLKLKVEMLQS